MDVNESPMHQFMAVLKAEFLARHGYAYKGESQAEMDKFKAILDEQNRALMGASDSALETMGTGNPQ